MMLMIFVSITSFAWNIVGGVIFWAFMNNALCSNNVFNYVFASLIIKYINIIICSFSNKNNKN